jgi:hypothetical protein
MADGVDVAGDGAGGQRAGKRKLGVIMSSGVPRRKMRTGGDNMCIPGRWRGCD